MNKLVSNYFLISVCFCLFLFFAKCKKDTHAPLNITLYNKSLDSIQLYTTGKWKMIYLQGGILGSNYIQRYDNFFWNLNSTKVSQTYQANIYADTTIVWTREKGVYTGKDSTYTLSFIDKFFNPWVCVVREIKNDTLILQDDAMDPFYYYLVRIN